MKQTKLIEFKNKTDNILRSILVIGKKTKKAVLMCGGFERSATTEKKFKVLADELIKQNVASLRFDYAGCGLSDGDFAKTTIQKRANDFRGAVKILQEKTNCENVSVITHSLSACVIANLVKESLFEKIILIAPALNQKDLLRYWFVASTMKKEKPKMKITWQNFKDYLNEEQFQNDCARTDKMTKANYISADYFLENKDKDYSDLLGDNHNILHIHGDKDDKAPLESLNVEFKNRIIIKGGNHDLERPDMMEQWTDKTINFIKEDL
ncbi:alpha/beta hydrolase [Candidatus Parcubacteria bacterium]|nr:alpha/beta hydrolase [Candidatus Parcubacteria bacterium]